MGPKLRRTIVAVVSDDALRRHAVRHGDDSASTWSRAELEAFALRPQWRGHDTDMSNLLYILSVAEKRNVARALALDIRGRRSRSDLQAVMYEFIDYHSATQKRRRARKRQLRPTAMTTDRLLEMGAELARPVTHLVPEGSGSPMATWHDPDPAVWPGPRGPQLWLSIHAAAIGGADRVVELWVDAGQGRVEVCERAGDLPTPGPLCTLLFGAAARELPTLDVLFLRGPAPMSKWLEENEWEGTYDSNFPDAETARPYQRLWWSEHPYATNACWVQLGGWPMTWPDEYVKHLLDTELVLRTYRDAEPWIEVFRRNGRYETRCRIT